MSARRQPAAPLSALKADAPSAAHELQIHQIELELQNAELKHARAELEAALCQYTDLYDGAPVSYFTLARDGAIQQVNLAGANLLGLARRELIQRRFGLFVSPESRLIFNRFLEAVASMNGSPTVCEVVLVNDRPEPLWVRLEAAPERGRGYRLVVSDITDRRQAQAAEQFRLQEIAIRQAIAEASLVAADENALIATASELIAAAFYPNHFGIALLNEATGGWRFHPASDLPEAVQRVSQPLEARRLGWIATTGQACRIDDLTAEPDCSDFMPGMRSALYAPIKLDECVIGVAVAQATRRAAFGETDENLLGTWVEQLALGISKVRLRTAERRRQRELEAIHAVSAALRTAQTKDAMLPVLIQKSLEAVRAEAGVLLLRQGDQLVCAAVRGPVAVCLGQVFPIAALGWPLRLPRKPPPDLTPSGDCEQLPAMASCIQVPLQTSDTLVGVLQLGFRETHALDDTERWILTAIAELASNALQRVTVLETLEQRVADRTRELAVLYDVSALASESLDLPVLLERSLTLTLEAIRFQRGTIHLWDPASQHLDQAAQHGLAGRTFPEITGLAVCQVLADWVFAKQQTQLLSTLSEAPATLGLPIISGLDSYVGAPIRARGEILGVLGIYGEVGQSVNAEDMALLTTIADQVGVAVDSVRWRHQAQYAAIREERQRLSRELHDSVTQSLYGVNLMAESAQRLLQAGQAEKALSILGELGVSAQQALKEMRLMVFELRPTALASAGLVGALQEWLEAVEQRAGVRAQLLVDDPPHLLKALAATSGLEETLYWIAREALNNSLKHAAADAVTVSLKSDSRHLLMEIIDDGRSFNPATTRGGLGILGMRERAHKLNARWQITSAPGQGTRVNVELALAIG